MFKKKNCGASNMTTCAHHQLRC